MDEIAIKIDHVSKEYKLGAIGGGTLRGDLQSWWARVRGQVDPNSKIGDDTGVKVGERFKALDDITFEVKKGEAVGIIGHNGAGKSTLLKLLSRVTAPTSGKISYNGKIAAMLEVGTGFHPELTGRENVYMNGAILGMTKAEIDRKFDQIVEFAEIEQFIDTPVKRYSSGMYVKLAFSVAAHLDSDIMVMDEVLAVGDMKFQQKCLSRMGDAANTEGRTVLYVSHNMNTIRQLCQRCIVLDHGRVIFDGETEEAISLYMENNAQMELEYDCSFERPYKDLDDKIHIDRLSFWGKEPPLFYSKDEPVNICMDYSANKALKNVSLRLVLQTLDKIRVGMATTNKKIDVSEGKQSILIRINTAWLAPGKYSCFMVLYSVNDYGAEQVHDRVDNVCVFEKVQGLGEVNRLPWNPTAWGHMTLPSIEIIENSER